MSAVSSSVRKRILQLAPALAAQAGITLAPGELTALADEISRTMPFSSQRDQVLELRRRFGTQTAPAPTGQAGPAAFTPSITPARIAPMSLQLDVAKARTAARIGTSSPSFAPQLSIFGDIFRGVKGAVEGFIGGGPVGAVRGAFRGITGPAPIATPGFAGPTPQDVRTALRIQAPGGTIAVPGVGEIGLTGGQIAFQRRAQEGRFDLPADLAGRPAIGCPSGFHPNKTGYFLRSGTFVAPESRCVRNRKRNPMNPRALSRAIARVESGKRVAKRLSRITIRKKCP